MNRWKTGAGDNKRQRGRGRKPSTPSNRSYESNGPEVKIRGNAPQIFDKYVQLARDASLAGDRVRAENLYQHAEHYFRLIQASQPRRDAGPDDMIENEEDDVADDGYERFSDRVEEPRDNNANNNPGNHNQGGNTNRDQGGGDRNASRDGNRDQNRDGNRDQNRGGDQNRNREPRRGRQPRQPRYEQSQNDPLNVVTPEGEAQPQVQPQLPPQTTSHHPIHAPVTPSSVAPAAPRRAAPEAASDDEPERRARRPRRPRSDEGETGATPAAPAVEETKPAKAPRAPRASRAKPKDDTSGGSESDAA